MGVKIRGESIGALGMRLHHEPSGTVITTEPPVDNGGDGSSFSPTDLCAASLGACASTIMRLYAARNGIALDAVTFELEKEMNGTPRRLGRLTVVYHLVTACSDADLARLEAAGRACPVRLSLGTDVVVDERYERA